MKIRIGTFRNSIIHFVGNKSNGDGVKFSNIETSLKNVETEIRKLIEHTFSFNEMYHFDFVSKLELNPVYNFISEIFENQHLFISQSHNITRYLYDQSGHSKIKGGELYIVYFKDCIVDDDIIDAVGLFKTENKDTFLQVLPVEDGFEIKREKGLRIDKLDKGCIVFNIEKEDGFLVASVDNTNTIDAKYWREDFLHIKQRTNDYYQTHNILSLCKSYLKDELPQEFPATKVDQALYLSKAISTLKDHNSITLEQFAQNIFVKPELIESFNKYKESYEHNQNVKIDDTFEVSNVAVKRLAKGSLQSVKLDKNFDLNIHGGEQFIERGYDEEKKMFFYKLYFIEEK